MPKRTDQEHSRRERQIMDILHRRTEASVADVVAGLPNPPTHTAVRAFLSILERKGHVLRRKDGKRFIYRPARSRRSAARDALNRVLDVFFDDSLGDAVAAHLANPSNRIDREELDRLAKIINEARKGDASDD